MLMNRIAIFASTSALLALCAIVATSAAPVLSNTAALKSAADNWLTDVRVVRRPGGRRRAVAAGIIGGLAIGAAARSSYHYGYSYPYYGYSYRLYGGYYGYGYPYGSGYYGYGDGPYYRYYR
jgi:hypothetical protein